MSGLAAVVHFDGAPAGRARIDRMVSAARHRGTDGCSAWISGAVALAHAALITTPEAAGELQPCTHAATGVTIVFDGRLDYRSDLAARLHSRLNAPTPTRGDADLALHAYLAWGPECARQLEGDFAFVLWDPRSRQLVAARDVCGARPLCYGRVGTTLFVASEPHQILAASGASWQVNEARIADHLASGPLQPHETLYRNLHRLPPAHTLVAAANVEAVRRYWDVDPSHQIRYRSDEEYAEHLRSLLDDAVRERLRSRGPVGILLSGGVDSSSIAGIVSRLRARSGYTPACELLSTTFPGRPSCDETPWIERVAVTWDGAAHAVPYRPAPTGWYAAQAAAYQDLPDYPNGATLDPLKTLAARRGVRVLLSGVGGDEWFTGSAFHYADWLRRGRLIRMFREARHDAAMAHRRRGFVPLVALGLWPLVPGPLRSFYRRVRGRSAVPPWISPAFARRVSLEERLRWPMDRGAFPTFAQAAIHRMGFAGINSHSEEIEERSAARAGVEQRYPFNDRRVIEFAMALPEEQRWRGGTRKVVLRRAMSGLVPDAILRRRDKAEFSEPYVDAIEAAGGRAALIASRPVTEGWIARAPLDALIDDYHRSRHAGDLRYCLMSDVLWQILSIDLWMSAGTRAPAAEDEADARQPARAFFAGSAS